MNKVLRIFDNQNNNQLYTIYKLINDITPQNNLIIYSDQNIEFDQYNSANIIFTNKFTNPWETCDFLANDYTHPESNTILFSNNSYDDLFAFSNDLYYDDSPGFDQQVRNYYRMFRMTIYDNNDNIIYSRIFTHAKDIDDPDIDISNYDDNIDEIYVTTFTDYNKFNENSNVSSINIIWYYNNSDNIIIQAGNLYDNNGNIVNINFSTGVSSILFDIYNERIFNEEIVELDV